MATSRPANRTETLPSGAEIEYWDAIGLDGLPQQRRYKVNGERYVSISTAAGVVEKPALMPAAVKLQEHGVVALAQMGVDIAAQTQESLRALLVEHGLHYDSIWQVARDRGDVAHDHLLHLIRDRKVARLSEYKADIRPWISAGMRFVIDHKPKVIQAEYMVASTQNRFAGRGDLFAILPQFGKAKCRVDFKTVTEWKYRTRQVKGVKTLTDEKLPPYEENLVQLGGYEIGAVESSYEASERRLIVRLGPDGQYDVFEDCSDPECFLRFLDAYRAKQAVLKPGAVKVEPATREVVAA